MKLDEAVGEEAMVVAVEVVAVGMSVSLGMMGKDMKEMTGEDMEAMMAFLGVAGLLRKLMVGDHMRDEEAAVGLVVPLVVAGTVNSAMERLLRVKGHAGHMTVTVGLEEGQFS